MEEINFKAKSILWISSTPVDVFLHSSATLAVVNELANLHHKVSFLSVRSKRTPSIQNDQVHAFFVPLKFVPLVSSIMFAIVLFFLLPILLIASKPDYVVLDPSVSIVGFLSGQFVSSFKKIRFILDIRSTPVETTGLRGLATKFLFRLSVITAKKQFDGMTTITNLMRKEICHSFNIESNSIGVWTSGVSESLFNPSNLTFKDRELKTKLGLTGKFVVFYHGVFSANRGLIETIKSMKIICKKHPDIIFFLLGAGPIIGIQKALVQEENLQENVVFHNPVSNVEVPKFIAMCDVGIIPLPDHPYWNAQNPIKLLEYLAMEKVVILTNIPAHEVVVGNTKCGIYISSNSPTEISTAIEFAYVNRVNLESWGKIGREIVCDKYTWRKVAADFQDYMYQLA